MSIAQGGCLCGGIRYAAAAAPGRVTICHCTFCQRATGSAFMVEPIFDAGDISVTAGTPKTYTHVSTGSGKEVYVHFCDTCGTKLFLTFERFAGAIGVYAGTFDDPNWFDVSPGNAKHIFLGVAQRGTIVPAGINTFTEHATQNDGTPIDPQVFGTPHVIGAPRQKTI
jgi:hypothetical protein|tara:strand:+ start:475 stop:978 length:504 start_codon:yes stop_codon:yes gene_type:complete